MDWNTFIEIQNKTDIHLKLRHIAEDKFINAASKRLGEDIEDIAEDYIVNVNDDYFNNSIEVQVDSFELWLEENKENV